MYLSCLVCDWLIKVYEKLPGMISNRMSLDASASQQQNKKIQQTSGFSYIAFGSPATDITHSVQSVN
jgi:hypothetical protein